METWYLEFIRLRDDGLRYIVTLTPKQVAYLRNVYMTHEWNTGVNRMREEPSHKLNVVKLGNILVRYKEPLPPVREVDLSTPI